MSNELYKFRAFLNTLDCSVARDSSISGFVALHEGNNYSRPSMDGELRIRDCGGAVSLEFSYSEKSKSDKGDINIGHISNEDSIQKLDLLISHLEGMKKAFFEGREHVAKLMIAWEKNQEEIGRKKKSNEENKGSN